MLPGGVMVAQQILDLLVKVRILAGQPNFANAKLVLRKRPTGAFEGPNENIGMWSIYIIEGVDKEAIYWHNEQFK